MSVHTRDPGDSDGLAMTPEAICGYVDDTLERLEFAGDDRFMPAAAQLTGAIDGRCILEFTAHYTWARLRRHNTLAEKEAIARLTLQDIATIRAHVARHQRR